MRDVESRIVADETQLTTDQLNVCLRAVEGAFKGSIDYAMLHKVFARVQDDDYSPAVGIGMKPIIVTGGRRPEAHQHVPRPVQQPDDADAHAPVHAAHERLQQEAREPRPHGRDLHRLVPTSSGSIELCA